MAGAPTPSRSKKSDWAAEELTQSETPEFATRAETASEDRAVKNAALAAAGDRLLANLAAEKSAIGMEEGYRPESGPTGEKPTVEGARVPGQTTAADSVGRGVVTEPRPAPDPVAVGGAPLGARREPVAAPSAPARPRPAPAPTPAPLRADGGSIFGMKAAPTPEASVVEMSMPQLLRELAGLRDDGILTDEEFGEAKAKLLARL